MAKSPKHRKNRIFLVYLQNRIFLYKNASSTTQRAGSATTCTEDDACSIQSSIASSASAMARGPPEAAKKFGPIPPLRVKSWAGERLISPPGSEIRRATPRPRFHLLDLLLYRNPRSHLTLESLLATSCILGHSHLSGRWTPAATSRFAGGQHDDPAFTSHMPAGIGVW